MKKIFFISVIILVITSNLNSQFINSIGFKIGGVSYYQHMQKSSENFLNDIKEIGFGYDFEVSFETRSYNMFTFIGALNFSDEGRILGNTPVYFYPFSSDILISNRYRFLSVQTLAKYIFSRKQYGFYIISGLRTGLMIQNYYSKEHANYVKLPNGHFRFGLAMGMGYLFKSDYLVEILYKPNFTNTYYVRNDNRDWNVKIYDQTFNLSFGCRINLNK
jgi:hypothetical protein